MSTEIVNLDGNCIIYVRSATENAENIAEQKTICQEYAQRRGLKPYAIIIDQAESADNLNREGLKELYKTYQQKRVGHILCSDKARLARLSAKYAEVLDHFHRSTMFHFVKHNIKDTVEYLIYDARREHRSINHSAFFNGH